MRQPRLRGRRGAFTLVELLVVMLIIAVLVSIVAAGVLKFIGQGPATVARTEIGQFQVAIEAFKREHNDVVYLPSVLVLWETIPNPTTLTTPAERESYSFLQKAFGRRAIVATRQIDWNNDGAIAPETSPWVLEGQQCLVFYLGGIPARGTNGTLGFSTNPLNPAAVDATGNATASFRPPSFPFKTDRLRREGPGGFFVYVDPYSTEVPQPYLYFSSRKSSNTYSADCPSYLKNANTVNTGGALLPYREPSGRFLQPDGFQIICAGADGVFTDPASTDVNATIWDPVNGNKELYTADNQANFASAVLGTGG